MILSCTISNSLPIIGKMFVFDRGHLSLTHSLGVTPKLNWHEETSTIALSCSVTFILISLTVWASVTSVTDGQTHRQTDRIAFSNSAL